MRSVFLKNATHVYVFFLSIRVYESSKKSCHIFFLANREFYLKYMKVMREELSRRSHHIFIKNKEDFIKYLKVSKEEFSRKCHLVYPVKIKEFSRNSIVKEILLLLIF